MKKKNIYVYQSQELLELFEQAGNAAKTMCVPIDYAKEVHVVIGVRIGVRLDILIF